MEWLPYALAYPVLFAAVNLVDKSVLSRVRSALAVFAWLGALYFLAGVALALSVPWPAAGGVHLTAGLAGGLANGLAYLFTYRGLQREEVSRVTGLIYLSPVLTALFAALLLGETLRAGQYAGVLLASAGAVALGAERVNGRLLLRPAARLLLLAALFWTLTDLFNKFTLAGLGYEQVLALNLMGVGAAALAALALEGGRAPLGEPRRVGWAVVLSAALNIVGVGALVRGISLGPVSLVVALGTPQPVYVLLGAWLLGAFVPGLREYSASREGLGARTLGVLLVAAGVAALVLA
jgi:drug/metabolite transporter (DMT)-like permease